MRSRNFAKMVGISTKFLFERSTRARHSFIAATAKITGKHEGPLKTNFFLKSFCRKWSKFCLLYCRWILLIVVRFFTLIHFAIDRMLQVYKKIHRFCDVIYYFTNGHWYFTNNNVQQLWKKLSPQDQEIFFFNMADLNWSEVINMSMFGIRTYLMKEDPSTIPIALKRYNR